jgi:hypothetical protein
MGKRKLYSGGQCQVCGAICQAYDRTLLKTRKYCSPRCHGKAMTLGAAAAPKPQRPCRHCREPFTPAYRSAVFCSKGCSSRWQAARLNELAKERPTRQEQAAANRASARAFVRDVNARTVCAHCGSQPIEWHNPEHVELNRRDFRIGRMVSIGRPIEKIQEEMAACTPLCRRCHMKEDGRLKKFVAARVRRLTGVSG